MTLYLFEYVIILKNSFFFINTNLNMTFRYDSCKQIIYLLIKKKIESFGCPFRKINDFQKLPFFLNLA